MSIAKSIADILKTEEDVKYREASEDGASFLYTKWSPNNYRFVLVRDNHIVVLPYIGKQRTGDFCDVYNESTLQKENTTIIDTLVQPDKDIKATNRLNTLGGLESIIILSTNASALSMEYKSAKKLTTNLPVLRQRYPRLRNIILINDSDMAIYDYVDIFKKAVEDNRIDVNFPTVLNTINAKTKAVVDLSNTEWYKAGVKNADNRNPLWYKLDVDDGPLHKVYRTICSSLETAESTEKANKLMDSEAANNDELLKAFYSRISGVMKNWCSLLGIRVAVEQALMYGYTYDFKKHGGTSKRYINNMYYNQEIADYLFNHDERHNEKLSAFVKEIDLPYLQQLSLHLDTGSAELYSLFKTFDFIFVYLQTGYTWLRYIPKTVNVEHPNSPVDAADYLNVIKGSMRSVENCPIRYTLAGDKNEALRNSLWSKHLHYALFGGSLVKIPEKAITDKKSKLSVKDQLYRIEQIIRLLWRTEAVSCYLLFIQTMNLWHSYEDVDSDMLKFIRKKHLASLKSNVVCPIDAGIYNFMEDFFSRSNVKDKGITSIADLYNYATVLGAIKQTDTSSYFENDCSGIYEHLYHLYDFIYFLAKGYTGVLNREENYQ